MTYQNFAISLAKRAGDIMRQHFAIGIKKEWKPEAHDTPVTVADKQINQLVIEEVAKAYPDHSVRAEEGSALKDGAEYVWVCDPLDGTIPFAHGIPTFVFSLALVKDGEVQLGVTYDPILDRLFIGEKGKGATMNGEPISVSTHSSFSHALIYSPQWNHLDYDIWKLNSKVIEKGAKLTHFNSVVYAANLIAAGEIAGLIFLGDEPHDGAAQKVIIEEAGGKVTDAEGNEQRYDQKLNGQICSNGTVLHDDLVALVQSVRRK